MIIHDDGHTNVIAADGLLPISDVTQTDKDGMKHIIQKGISSRTNNKGFQFDRFNFIITNPPFGSSVRQTEQAYMHQYGYAQKEIDWLNPKSKVTPRDNQSTEVLFIEQCYNYLAEDGYLAVVLPDGVLTNSSMQYVRDGIEDKFRIIAIVSMPQTAFAATGAGVKSSVLFLRKYKYATTESIKNKKLEIQSDIKFKNNFIAKLKEIDADKKRHIKGLIGFNNTENLEGKTLTDSEQYKEWRKEVNSDFKEKVDFLKDQLSAEYTNEKQKKLANFSIFMAIAEDIGYDATGKETHNNELEDIMPELERFIVEEIEGQ
jgi:type I restriction-modification system DNA methylase subunit